MNTNTLETELREAVEARDAIVRESAALQERSARLAGFETARNDAQAELDAIARAEADALTAWARDGLAGRAPQPDTKAREAAAKKLAAAEYSMRAVGIAHQQLDEEYLGLVAKLELAQASVQQARARALGEHYMSFVAKMRDCYDTLECLQIVAHQLSAAARGCDLKIVGAIDGDLESERVRWISTRGAQISEAAQREVAQVLQAIPA